MGGSKSTEARPTGGNGITRLIIVGISVVVEASVLMFGLALFDAYTPVVTFVIRVLALFLVLAIYGQHKTPSIRITWIMLILVAPLFGVTIYVLIGLSGSTRKMRGRFEEINRVLMPKLPMNEDLSDRLKEVDVLASNISHYVKRHAGFPIYQNTKVTYHSEAKDALEDLLRELAKAEKFIFMEYHAIEDAESFRRIEEVLVDRVRHGVEVRLFYDDAGSIVFINTDFVEKMEALGIKCRVFNPFSPGMRLFLHNRDHRKITVIDGKVGFTGGYNLANEYFNIQSPYGYWKDTGVMLEGEAVRSLTVHFLEMWNAVRAKDVNDDNIEPYFSVSSASEVGTAESADKEGGKIYAFGRDGLVQPYSDSPMDNENVGENVYISMVESAKDYVYFMTPYLIITDEMIHALGLAAKRGVDVRIITPGIPDKKLIYHVTRSYYSGLARNGVRIFEFTPGFCHAKMAICDDFIATCGTINLDYRSLYHHFENSCLLFGGEVIGEIKRDFVETMEKSEEVTDFYAFGRGRFIRFWQLILRLGAPLL